MIVGDAFIAVVGKTFAQPRQIAAKTLKDSIMSVVEEFCRDPWHMVAKCLSHLPQLSAVKIAPEVIFIAVPWWVELGRRHNYGDYGGANCLQQIIILQTSAGRRKKREHRPDGSTKRF